MDLADGLGEDACGRDRADLGTGLDIRRRRERVGHHDAFDAALVDAFHRRPGEDWVGRGSEDAARTMFLESLSRVHEGARRVDHVVDQDYVAVGDVTDHVHDLGHVRPAPPLVHDGQASGELQRVGARPVDTAGVWAHHHEVGELQHPQLLDEDGRCVQVVDWPVEEALDLSGVELHGDDPIGAGRGQEIADQARGDRVASGSAAVLPTVAEVGDDGRDAAGGRPLERVDHDQELHEVVVDRPALRAADALRDEDVATTHRLLDLDSDLAVREPRDGGLPEFAIQISADRPCQLRIGVAREHHETVHDHLPGEDRKRPPWAVLS